MRRWTISAPLTHRRNCSLYNELHRRSCAQCEGKTGNCFHKSSWNWCMANYTMWPQRHLAWREGESGKVDDFPWWQLCTTYVALSGSSHAWRKVKLPEKWRNRPWRERQDIDERQDWTTALLTEIRRRLSYHVRLENKMEIDLKPYYWTTLIHVIHCAIDCKAQWQNSDYRSCAANVEDRMPTIERCFEGVAYFKHGGLYHNGCLEIW